MGSQASSTEPASYVDSSLRRTVVALEVSKIDARTEPRETEPWLSLLGRRHIAPHKTLLMLFDVQLEEEFKFGHTC